MSGFLMWCGVVWCECECECGAERDVATQGCDDANKIKNNIYILI